jgi:hypothetical protein
MNKDTITGWHYGEFFGGLVHGWRCLRVLTLRRPDRVGNLPADTTEDNLWDFFADCEVTVGLGTLLGAYFNCFGLLI